MPRLPFSVLYVSSEERENPATELYNDDQGTKGWASERFCSWPQSLVLRLGSPGSAFCRIDRLRLLSHQFKIPTRVDIFVGSGASADWLDAQFRRLGHVSLSSNAQSEYKARELKSVHLDGCEAQFLKLIMHKCHMNSHNVYSQVSIVGLYISGVEVAAAAAAAADACPPQAVRQNAWPAQQQQQQPEFSEVDSATAALIERINTAKERAARQEDYMLANTLKMAIEKLRVFGQEIAVREAEKARAVRMEDYAAAAQLKAEIDRLRAEASAHLPQLDEEEYDFNPREIFSAMPSREGVPPPPVVASSAVSGVAALVAAAPLPVPVFQSVPQIAELSQLPSSPRKPQSQPQPQPQPQPRAPGRLHTEEEPIIPVRRVIAPVLPEDAVDAIPEGAPVAEPAVLRSPSPLALPRQVEMQAAIDVFGMRMVEKLLSQNRIHRETAIKEATAKLRDPFWAQGKAENVFLASVLFAMQAVADSIPSNIFASYNLLEALDDYALMKYLRGKVPQESFNTVLSVLVVRLGDGSQRIREETAKTLFTFAKGFIGFQTVLSFLVRPPRAGVNWRQWAGRLGLLADIVQVFRTELDSGLGNFLFSALQHTVGDVRSAAIHVFLEMYRLAPETTRRAVTDLNPPHLELILDAFDENDGKVKPGSRGGSERPRFGDVSPRRPGGSAGSSRSSRPPSELASRGAKPVVRLDGLSSPQKESPRKLESPRKASTSPRKPEESARTQQQQQGSRPQSQQRVPSAVPALALPTGSRMKTPDEEPRPISEAAKKDSRSFELDANADPSLAPQTAVEPVVSLPASARSQQQQQQQQQQAQQPPSRDSAKSLSARPRIESAASSRRAAVGSSQSRWQRDVEEEEEEEEMVSSPPVEEEASFEEEEEEEGSGSATEDLEEVDVRPPQTAETEEEEVNEEVAATDTASSDFLCSFCQMPLPDEDARGTHYLYDCPLLGECPQCEQVIEIACANEHLLQECESGTSFKQCPRCQRVLRDGAEFSDHIAACSDSPGHRCLLCDKVVVKATDSSNMTPDEVQQAWYEHLTIACPHNPRRPRDPSIH